LKFAASIEGSSTQVIGKKLAEYLNSIGWEIELVGGTNSYGSKSLQALIDGEIDLAFIQNDLAHTRESNDIKTVIPLFPNISYIFYRDHLEPANLSDPLVNNSVLISSDDEKFYKDLFLYYGVNLDSIQFNTVDFGNSVEDFLNKVYIGKDNVFCVFAAIHTPHIKSMIDANWEILSLGDIAFSNKGSSVEGFCMNYPRSEPFIVPRNFFGQKPEYPIYTISMDELLVVHEDADETLIYDLVNDIYEGKHYLSQNDILFNYITEDFDHDALNFPLHDSTIDYLQRDEPTFFERYAEAFGVIFSIMVVAIGGLTSLRKIRKERIDKYYKRVMNCHDMNELDEIADEAVKQLQNEKLTADESFTIFLNLVDKRKHEIENNPINV
jgi:TRAP-type uncharacterized transport system substrate-binding protein